MKNTILTLILTVSTLIPNLKAQDLVDLTEWTFNNTAGLESYGAITTTLTGGTPYYNNAVTYMKSPVYNYNNSIDVSFTLNGRIQKNYDYMYFQYKTNSGWITLDEFTGKHRNIEYSYKISSLSGDIKFRFKLVTDNCINTFNNNSKMYYYDVFDFLITPESALPVTMGGMFLDCSELTWSTESEHNSVYFSIYYSPDGISFENQANIMAAGNSNEVVNYSFQNSFGSGYFYIEQFDYDGSSEVFPTLFINCGGDTKQIKGIYDINGNEVDRNTQGLKIIVYTDGTSKKIYNTLN